MQNPKYLKCVNKSLQGFTLIEMVVSLAVLSILASVTLPYVEIAYKRTKEIKLQQSLRTIRSSIDRFYEDCAAGLIVKAQDGVSRDCYPTTLEAMVEGVESSEADGGIKYYLRRIPRDPFSDEDDIEAHWEIRGYNDSPDGSWSGDDVYDVRVQHDLHAINGTVYKDW